MKLLISALNGNKDELIGLAKGAGDEQQAKIAALMPKVQAVVIPKIAEANVGLPPGPMGTLHAHTACVAASTLILSAHRAQL